MDQSCDRTTILVVDDDADCRELLADLLSHQGYAVVCARNGREALDCINSSTPALMILDLMMPVMSGWELLEQQKNDPKLESLPVVVMTASGLVQNLSAEAVIHKPIDFKALMKVVKQLSHA
jgi:CheY-like chemotaxis protein